MNNFDNLTEGLQQARKADDEDEDLEVQQIQI